VNALYLLPVFLARGDWRRCGLAEQAENDSRREHLVNGTKADFREAMRAWQKMSRAFFARFDKTCHVFSPVILAKDVERISGQAVTLLDILYLIPSPYSMLSRKEVLTMCVVALFENGDARRPEQAPLAKLRSPLNLSRHLANASKISQALCTRPSFTGERRSDGIIWAQVLSQGIGYALCQAIASAGATEAPNDQSD